VPKEVELTLIYIRWVDSCHQGGWISVSDLFKKYQKEELIQETAGFLLKETEYSYMVAQSKGAYWSPGGESDFAVDAIMEIPKVAVVEVRELVKKRKCQKT